MKCFIAQSRILAQFALLAWLCLANGLWAAVPLGTAITYSGSLSDSGRPAQGSYDLTFALFDASLGGSSVGSVLTNLNTAVSNGLFTVALDFGADVFTDEARWLEIAVRTNGAAAFTVLATRQALRPLPYSITAGKVTGLIDGGSIRAGTVTATQLAAGAVGAGQLASNSITADQLAPGAALANLQASGQSGVPSGGVVLSANENDSNLANAGYVKLGKIESSDMWEQGASGDPPPARRMYHTAVWTGSEMIVWGGEDYFSQRYNDGGRYSPAINSWTAVTTNGAPTARSSHTAVWTGSEMIIWGGIDSGVHYRNDGGRYNPVSNLWAAVTTNGAPSGRRNHTAVWTGGEMIVWGGWSGSNNRNDGGRYSPANNAWIAVATNGAPGARSAHTAIWATKEMIIWGGWNGSMYADGKRYYPTTNGWAAVTNAGAPTGRRFHTAVWTGSEMIVWSGEGDSGPTSTGARYNPGADSWTVVSTNSAPAAREGHTAVWAGNEVNVMIVWGGVRAGAYKNDGGCYDPAANTWKAAIATSAPAGRSSHTAVWTGSEMIVWGGAWTFGVGDIRIFNDGGRYSPVNRSWVPVPTNAPPAARTHHTTVWTGSEMIVWGGGGYGSLFNSGGCYHPEVNTWTAVNTNGAPAARIGHTAVWADGEIGNMIVWGGRDGNGTLLYDGGRYSPVSNLWIAVTTNGAPSGRQNHTAVWTGREMVVWGGIGEAMLPPLLNDGGRYNPVSNLWVAVTTDGAPTARQNHTAVWIGSNMIVWGGEGLGAALPTGGRYDPTNDNWAPITADDTARRYGHTAVWTGSSMIVWGGCGGLLGPVLNDGWRYDPTADTWVSLPTNNAPAPRMMHTAVWTGREMIVWGGHAYHDPFDPVPEILNSGGRYRPSSDSWTLMTDINAPRARYGHTAVWTGTNMIVWGGTDESDCFKDTWSYKPPQSFSLYLKP